MDFDRRDLLKGVLLTAATGTLSSAGNNSPAARTSRAVHDRPWKVVDTNLDLFQWPFRRLPYDEVDKLVEKLRSLQIDRAWAGSFKGLLHRDLDGVNRRLADACRKQGRGLLVPIGSVNPALPGWEETLRRCQEEHRMPGIRLHPNYHGYTLDDPRFERLLETAADRGLLVQLAASMEDTRTQHPLVQVPDVDLGPLPELVKKIPQLRVMLLNHGARGGTFDRLLETPRVYFDIARVESTGGVARLLRSAPRGRVVFGTHAPFFIYESALIKVYESDLSEKETRALFAENAGALIADDLVQ